MDDTREYGLNQGYGNDVNCTESGIDEKYVEEDDDEVEDEEEEEEEEQDETNVSDNELNQTPLQNRDNDDHADDDDDDDEYEDDEDHNGRQRNDHVNNHHRHPKKRKLKSLLSSYEFAPRVPPPTSAPKPSFGGRNTLTDWSEHETFVLLDAWGGRFIKCGKKSLRSEEWLEVADRVSHESKIERTDSQCRNRLDTLKKKYKKEKANLNSGKIINTKWVYFKKMDMLLSSGGKAFVNRSVNLNNTNGVNETKGISGNSYSHDDDDEDDEDDDDDDDDDNDDGLGLIPPKKSNPRSSFKLLAESINKFSDIYEKIENKKIQQMIELEKMKMDFHKDLELQKRQILDKAQAEITKLEQGGYDDNDVSAENISG